MDTLIQFTPHTVTAYVYNMQSIDRDTVEWIQFAITNNKFPRRIIQQPVIITSDVNSIIHTERQKCTEVIIIQMTSLLSWWLWSSWMLFSSSSSVSLSINRGAIDVVSSFWYILFHWIRHFASADPNAVHIPTSRLSSVATIEIENVLFRRLLYCWNDTRVHALKIDPAICVVPLPFLLLSALLGIL